MSPEEPNRRRSRRDDRNNKDSSGSRDAPTLDADKLELLTNRVVTDALDGIRKRVQWPLLLAAAFASYMGYNLWTDAKNRIDEFQRKSNEKLSEIDKSANQRLDAKLGEALDARKADLHELIALLRKESAAALIEAERAKHAASESAANSRLAIDQVRRQAQETIASLELQLRDVRARGAAVLKSMDLLERDVSQRNKTIIEDTSQSSDERGIVNQAAFGLLGLKDALREAGDAPITVAIISTGIASFPTTKNGESIKRQLMKGRAFPAGDDAPGNDEFGTKLASIVGVMAPKSRILPINVLSPRGLASIDSNIVSALDFAASSGARIVLLPLGVEPGSAALRPETFSVVFQRLRVKGILVFVSAGNKGTVWQPANAPLSIAVAATDPKDELSRFSSTGPEIAFAAPGQDIVAIAPNGTYDSNSGTSFSAAIAAGLAALVLSTVPALTPDELEDVLKRSAKRLPITGIGAGRVDAIAAVRLAKEYSRSRK